MRVWVGVGGRGMGVCVCAWVHVGMGVGGCDVIRQNGDLVGEGSMFH